MILLSSFDVDDLIACSHAIADAAQGAATMSEAAQATAGRLYELLRTSEDTPATALVRIYKTHSFGKLPEDVRDFAARTAVGEVDDTTACLTLLGSAGVEAGWNDVSLSTGHRAIPLTDADAVTRSPMIAALLHQLGVDVQFVIAPESALRLLKHHESYNLFHVDDAVSSPMIPAKDFVRDYGILEVIGCGGILPSGDFFSLIVFCTEPLPPERADLFRSLAFSVKAALAPHCYAVFSTH